MALSNLPVHQLFRHTRTVALFFVLLLVSYTAALAEGSATVADVLARVNRERTSRGLPAFTLNAQLTAAAHGHASDIARTGKYSHTGSDGSTTEQRVARAGYGKAERIGENWAAYRTLDDAIKFWMVSAPHKANILHPVYREIGIGITPASTGALIIVLDFGARTDAPSPNAATPVPTAASMPALAGRSERAAGTATPKESGGLPAVPAEGKGSLPAAPQITGAPQKSADAAPTRTSTRASSPTPARPAVVKPTATRTPRPATPVPSPTPATVASLAVPPAYDDEPLQLDDEALADEQATDTENTAARPQAQPAVSQVAQSVATSVRPAIASAVPAQAVKTQMDLLAGSVFGLALLLGIWAVFKYMRP